MSVQILLQGKIFGTEEFLLAGEPEEPLFAGRLRWVSLLSEVLPRALLAELGLSKMLLGSSGGEQFLVVLPSEVRPQAEEFMANAARHIDELSHGSMKLICAVTENLGDWSDVRKRLNESMQAKLGAPLTVSSVQDPFEPFTTQDSAEAHEYFSAELGRQLRETHSVGWSPESPALVHIGG